MSETNEYGQIEMKPIIEQFITDFRIQSEDNVMRAVGEYGIHVDKQRLMQALTDARDFYEEGYRAAMRSIVHCLYCEHYKRGQCYHPRHEHHAQGIEQNPTDFCNYGDWRVNHESL